MTSTWAAKACVSLRRGTALRACFLVPLLVAPVLLCGAPAFAQDKLEHSASMAGEGSKIKPVAERKIGKRERPTVKQKKEQSESERRATRVSLQIPERLRKALAKKIDRRIERNLAKTRTLRRAAIKLLVKFVEESPKNSYELPEALLRLGELEWEDARDQFLVDFERWEERPVDQRGDPPSPDYAGPRQRFLHVLREHKTFRDYDLALYIDGFLASEEGKFEDALGRFNKILEWFPNSRFVADAHMVRAEFEFTKDHPDYQVAYREYEEVLKHKDSELYDLAMFKSAWTLWRLGRTDEAARRFLIVFQATEEEGRRSSAKRRTELDELQAEALRNLVAVFVEDEKNRAEDMHLFLVKAGGDKFAGRIVLALANAFYDQAHYERGIEAYRLLLKLDPNHPDAYKHALKIAQGHSTMEAWGELSKGYRWILSEYVPPETPPGGKPKKAGAWTKAQTQSVLKAATNAVESQLYADAVGLHAKAQADKSSRAEFAATADLYDVYLSRFSKNKDAYETYFNLAEIHFYHLENASEAAAAYMAAVRINPKGKLSRDALYNALAALEVARAAEFEAAKKAGRKPEETPTDKQLTEAMELYVKTYPDDPDVPELLFRQGKLYYDYQVYDPAVRQWGLLLEKYPNSKYSVGAGELILDSFNKSEDFANIETWARRLKKTPAFQQPAHQAKLDALIIGAVFKLGEQHADKGEHDKAAAAYLRAASEFPREERAAQAAVNAEIEARRAADLESLKAAAALLIRDHKQRKEAPQGVWIAAKTFQEVGLFAEAAGYHETLMDNWPRDEHHKDAAFNAVLLRTTIGDHDKAIADGNKFKKYYPRGDETDEVTFLMGKAHEKAKKTKDAELLYNRYANGSRNPSRQIEALVRLASVRVDDRRGADAALSRAMTVYKHSAKRLTEEGKYFAAKARYMQGERILSDYEAVKIEGDVIKLKQRLKKKSELLKKAADAFLSTAEMGVAEWTTAALYQIGFTYESFAKALLNSPPPASLSAQEQELYKQSIEEFVIPIEERSIEAYESGWDKAIELGIFNSWTAKMRAALGRLNSELYPPLKEIGFELRSKGPLPLPPLIDSPRRGTGNRSQVYLLSAPEPARDDKAAEQSKTTGKAKGGGK